MSQEPDGDRLRAALDEQAAQAVPTRPGLWPAIADHLAQRPRRTAQPLLLAGGAALLLLLVGGIAWQQGRLGNDLPPQPLIAGAGPQHPIPKGPPAFGGYMVAAPGDQWVARNDTGLFQIVMVDVRAPREILLFYAMQARTQAAPAVTVRLESQEPGTPAASVVLPVTAVQPLGPLAEFTAGVIHVAWARQTGTYTLVVEAVPPGGAPGWRVTPVHDLRLDPLHDLPLTPTGQVYEMMTDAPPALGQVSIAGPTGGRGVRLALLGRNPQLVPPLNVVIDADGTVRLLDTASWNALWPTPPPFNGTVEPTEDLEHPYIAPTYPPTPTWDPTAPTFTPALPPPPPTAVPGVP